MTAEGDGGADGFGSAAAHNDVAGAEGALKTGPDPGQDGDVVLRIEGDELGLPVALVRFNREGALGGDCFDTGNFPKDGKDAGIERGRARLTREQGGGEVVGDTLGQDEDVRPQTVEGVLQSRLDGLAEHQGQEDGGGADRDGGREEEDPPGTAPHLLQEKAETERQERQDGPGVRPCSCG